MQDTRTLSEGDRVVVIGAGPAGLTLAYLLAKQGVEVVVLEASDAVGGISQTAKYRGYRFDIGGHRFFTKIKPVAALWDELLGDELLVVPRLSRILYNGRFFNYPLTAVNAVMGLGPVNALRILASYAKAKVQPSREEITFEQWVTNRFGKRLYEIFFRTYTEKVWGTPCSEISAEWAAQRIQGLSLARAILSATPLMRRNSGIKSLITEMKYPRLGPGQMWEACRDRILEMGGKVLMQHRMTEIELVDGVTSSVLAEHAGTSVRIAANHVVSTTDLRSLVAALGDNAPAAVKNAAQALRYRDFLLVALILDRENVFPDSWIYVHTPGVAVGRIQNFKNWSSDMVQERGRTCLGMEYFCFQGDGLWTANDESLIAQATRELEMIGLASASEVVDATVVRMPKAYPIYDSGYRNHVDSIREFLEAVPNLHTIGRNGMHKYNNQDHSMYTAILTVENMMGTHRHDVWAVNTDSEYHEEQRVE